jgi:hypothetical protein
MDRATSILTVLFFIFSLGAGKTALAFEKTPSMPTKTKIWPSIQSAQGPNVLRQLALALAGGSSAMRTLRGSPYGDDEKDRLQPPMPGMDCGIDRILSYVSCYSSIIDSEKEAGNLFTQFVYDLQAALPSDSWRKVDNMPAIGSIRSSTYEDQTSGAQIDIDLIARPTPQGAYSYVLTIYGWTATEAATLN